ncbi:hypothetical protein AGLY_016662 [Aphis glycines]|uniref:RNase H type-1 domain-containing protein n=1 Tax=Aphis glycines TaxID=307491 RepID=A0A6G0SZC2_APHGL|nr:hypothetical protein AGLY_016662 [Aphis glycines]
MFSPSKTQIIIFYKKINTSLPQITLDETPLPFSNNLHTIYNQGIKLATGAIRTSPVDSVLCNAGEPPLQIIRNINTIKYMIKTSNLPDHISSSNFRHPFLNHRAKTPNTIYENFNRIKENNYLNIDTITKFPMSSFAPWTWSLNINTELLKFNKNSTENSIIVSHFHELIDLHYHNHTLIYTDASKISNGSGFATVDGSESETSASSIHQHIHGGIICDIHGSPICSICPLIALRPISSESQNELIQLTKECITSSKNKINFMWVPSHRRYDEMADEAITSGSASFITKIITTDLINDAQKRIL